MYQSNDSSDMEDTVEMLPSFAKWDTVSLLTINQSLNKVAQLNVTSGQYVRTVNVSHEQPFTLVPVILTQGPFRGQQALILEPERAAFRFMDLPPELRNKIYSYLVVEEEPVRMCTAAALYEYERPIRCSSLTPNGHEGFKWDDKTSLWIDQPPSAHAILRVSKQMHSEAAPLAYGNNVFHFETLWEMKIFAERVGDMLPLVRHIRINGCFYPHNKSKIRSAFSRLRYATGLRTLSFHHGAICRGYSGNHLLYPQDLREVAQYMRGMMRTLRKTRLQAGNEVDPLTMIKLDWDRCRFCASHALNFPNSTEPYKCKGSFCGMTCKNAATHCKEVEAKLRELIAEKLGNKE